MECARLKNWHFCWNKMNKLSVLDSKMDKQVTDISFVLAFMEKIKINRKGASYCIYVNTTILDNKSVTPNVRMISKTTFHVGKLI